MEFVVVLSVIGECVVDKGCGSDWVVRNVMEVFGVICGEGVGGLYVVNSSGMCEVIRRHVKCGRNCGRW